MDLDDLTQRARAMLDAARGRRVVLGIVGAPGSGKSTLARRLVSRIGAPAVQVPMDGFHLADVALRERGLLSRKGAIETFDGRGFLALLRRIRADDDDEVLAPAFERDLEQPIAGSIIVGPQHRLVVTEGNYLLDASDPWPLVRAELDAVWFVDLEQGRRRSRLVDRHIKHGRSRPAAQAWVDDVDEPNAQRVLARRHEADLVIEE